MKEYIVAVQDDERDFEEVFIAHIRNNTELIRCKDCKYWSGDGYFCGYDMIAFEDDYCSQAKPKKSTQVDHD